MHSFKGKIKVVIAVILVVAVLYGLDFLLYPCTFMRNDIHTVCTEYHDDIYLGTSHGKINIDPETIRNVTGRTGHNLCVGGEYGIDVYYLTKLLIEKNKPERILYEIDPGYFVLEKEPGNNYLLFYHEFPFSMAKLEYFKASLLDCDFRTILFPWYEYSLEYELGKIKDTVYQKFNKNYDVSYLKGQAQEYHESGFIERYAVDVTQLKMQEPRLFSEDAVKQENMEYLDKLIKLCEKEGIEFIALTTPLPEATMKAYPDSYRAAWDYFGEFFSSRNVSYINFNTEYYDLFSHDIVNFTDYDGHMNGEAAVQYSEVLGQLLKDYGNR